MGNYNVVHLHDYALSLISLTVAPPPKCVVHVSCVSHEHAA